MPRHSWPRCGDRGRVCGPAGSGGRGGCQAPRQHRHARRGARSRRLGASPYGLRRRAHRPGEGPSGPVGAGDDGPRPGAADPARIRGARRRAGRGLPALRLCHRLGAAAHGLGDEHRRRGARRGRGNGLGRGGVRPPSERRRPCAGGRRGRAYERTADARRYGLHHRALQRVRPGQDAGLARHRHLPGLPGGAGRSVEPALPPPVHHLHALWPPVHDRHRPSVRPGRHHDGGLRDVRGLPGGVRGPARPALPRPADRLSRLRTAARTGRRGRRVPVP